jgi:hypothetical protein
MALPHKLCLAKVMGPFLSGLVYHLYRSWHSLHHNVADIQATLDEVESGDRSEEDRSRAI